MANISHFTQTVNGTSTTYDIHDANAVPRSGGAVFEGQHYMRTVDNGALNLYGGTGYSHGASLLLTGKNGTGSGEFNILANNGTTHTVLKGKPNGTLTWDNKNVAMAEDVIPRSGGAVISGPVLSRTVDDSELRFDGGTMWGNGASISISGKNRMYSEGSIAFHPSRGADQEKSMLLAPDGTWTWTGQAVQLVSDQRYKQQIAEIDDKLLDAWQDVDLVQFKYNDAVDSKGDKARLHTGFVVQQIDSACKSHGVDISNYGLYCHEQYPEETEEVEIEQADGTTVKEKKVIREASEHYSLRYTEALIVECKYLRRCVEQLTARIEELEKGKEQEASK